MGGSYPMQAGVAISTYIAVAGVGTAVGLGAGYYPVSEMFGLAGFERFIATAVLGTVGYAISAGVAAGIVFLLIGESVLLRRGA